MTSVSLRVWALKDVVVSRRPRAAVGVVAFALATTFGAQVAVHVPGTPVPITLQTLFVILAGVVLGPRLGALSVALYVAVGAAGAPVFSNGGAGIPWLLGPTGGYLLAAPLSAAVSGLVAGRSPRLLRALAGLVLGTATLYLGGIAQLGLLTGQSIPSLLAMGVLPFMIGDAVKICAALWLVRMLRSTSFRDF
jgi:biotin transport system substrate-specific component